MITSIGKALAAIPRDKPIIAIDSSPKKIDEKAIKELYTSYRYEEVETDFLYYKDLSCRKGLDFYLNFRVPKHYSFSLTQNLLKVTYESFSDLITVMYKLNEVSFYCKNFYDLFTTEYTFKSISIRDSLKSYVSRITSRLICSCKLNKNILLYNSTLFQRVDDH